ncbi:MULTISPECIES: hypothetical protein [Sphingobacterium]|uniref:hypothetical protein n=1 Tax=Sphingobacterium TaxID=28453 RepID=UPI002580989D|nr:MULTISPECIES: hypothetical protein [Sphingobacterium]
MNPNISILIVDDDMNKIQNIITTIKAQIKDVPLRINQAISISEAKQYLKKDKYHLLISDLQMPLHEGGELIPKAGEILVREIYKVKNRLNVPLYIIGLTQHRQFISNFNNLWKVLFYNMSEESWKIYLRDLIFHIYLIKSNLSQFIIETIFVEGVNDFKLLQKTTELYYEELLTMFKIEYIDFGGGTSWVERKIQIWSKTLNRKEDGSYLKSIGLFDHDLPGLKSIEIINQSIRVDSAERNTFTILSTSAKYSPLLKSIKSKGINFYTTMEDLIGIDIWQSAKENGWLESRKETDFINNVKVDEEFLLSEGFTEEEILQILFKVKSDFCL